MNLNLGCADRVLAGFVNVDITPGPGITLVDLRGAWPWPDGSVTHAVAWDIIEHLPDKIHTMNELWRVLVPGGTAEITVPTTDGPGAFQDPTHCCYAADTEVLTIDGFKLFEALTGDEWVYAYNPETMQAEPQPCVALHAYDYDGDMVHFYGRAMDCLVTPNHMMYVGSSDEVTLYRFVSALDLYKGSLECVHWTRRLPSGVTFWGNSPEYIVLPDSEIRFQAAAFVRFMGWYLSEGWTTVHTEENGRYNFYRIGIGQSLSANPQKYEEIGECIRALGFNPYPTKLGWAFNSKPLAFWLSKLGHSHQKYIPEVLKAMSPDLLQEMLDTLLKGDGSQNGNGHTYASISWQLAADVQEIATRCGYRATMSREARIGLPVGITPGSYARYDMNLVYLSHSKYRYLTNVELKPYKGKVYCVTVPEHHVIMTRRNGKVIWAGNSFWNVRSFLYYEAGNIYRERFAASYGIRAAFRTLSKKVELTMDGPKLSIELEAVK